MRVAIWLAGLVLMMSIVANAQDVKGDFHVKRSNGYELTVSFEISGSKITKINYDEWTPVNKSAHECGLDASSGDDQSKWSISGNTTVVSSSDDENSTITITQRNDGVLITSGCNDTKLLFVKTGDKFIGRILK